MVFDAWVSPTAVQLRLLVAIAKARKMRAEGRELVTRERTTESMGRPPLPSSYVKFEESIPMIPDHFLRDYLKEDLTYRDFRTWLMRGRSTLKRSILQDENCLQS